MTAAARFTGSLHGVLLPRSWVLALWKDFNTFRERTLAPLWVLAQTTEILLRDIYTGEYLSHTSNLFGESIYNVAPTSPSDTYRLAGSQEQSGQLVNGLAAKIPTRPRYCPHVSVMILILTAATG